jgi:hypothetical protein
MPAGSFTADITAIRERARQKTEQGFADEEERADDIVGLLGA